MREHTSGSGRLGCTHVGIRGRGQKSRSSSRLEASIFWWTSHATTNPQVSFSFLLPVSPPTTPYPLPSPVNARLPTLYASGRLVCLFSSLNHRALSLHVRGFFKIIVNKGMDSFLPSFISRGGVREFSHRP